MLRSAGLAARVDFLFSKWDSVSSINNESAKAWDERLKQKDPAPIVSNGKIERITARITTLKQHLELLNEKLSLLEKDYIIQVDPAQKFYLKNRIAETKAACQKVEDEIKSLENQIG